MRFTKEMVDAYTHDILRKHPMDSLMKWANEVTETEPEFMSFLSSMITVGLGVSGQMNELNARYLLQVAKIVWDFHRIEAEAKELESVFQMGDNE